MGLVNTEIGKFYGEFSYMELRKRSNSTGTQNWRTSFQIRLGRKNAASKIVAKSNCPHAVTSTELMNDWRTRTQISFTVMLLIQILLIGSKLIAQNLFHR